MRETKCRNSFIHLPASEWEPSSPVSAVLSCCLVFRFISLRCRLSLWLLMSFCFSRLCCAAFRSFSRTIFLFTLIYSSLTIRCCCRVADMFTIPVAAWQTRDSLATHRWHWYLIWPRNEENNAEKIYIVVYICAWESRTHWSRICSFVFIGETTSDGVVCSRPRFKINFRQCEHVQIVTLEHRSSWESTKNKNYENSLVPISPFRFY